MILTPVVNKHMSTPSVMINGIEYVPKTEVIPPDDTALNRCIAELVDIQYFYAGTGKPRANAWDALNHIAPNIASMCSLDVKAAYDATRIPKYHE